MSHYKKREGLLVDLDSILAEINANNEEIVMVVPDYGNIILIVEVYE